jgi:hypothetical protein
VNYIKTLIINSTYGENKTPAEKVNFAYSFSDSEIFTYWYDHELTKQQKIEELTGYKSDCKQIFSDLVIDKSKASFSIIENYGRGDVVTKHELSIHRENYIDNLG